MFRLYCGISFPLLPLEGVGLKPCQQIHHPLTGCDSPLVHFLCSDTLGWVTLLTKAFHQNVLKILLSLKLEKCCGMQAVMRTIDASRFSYIKEHQGLAPMHQHDTRLSHLFLWEWQLLLTSISNLDKYRATRSLCSFDKS